MKALGARNTLIVIIAEQNEIQAAKAEEPKRGEWFLLRTL